MKAEEGNVQGGSGTIIGKVGGDEKMWVGWGGVGWGGVGWGC
jgi:hypothetical protein